MPFSFVVVQQGSLGGSVPNSGSIADNSEYAQGSGALEHAQHQTNGELVVDNQQHECGVGEVRPTTRSKPRKAPRKRNLDRGRDFGPG